MITNTGFEVKTLAEILDEQKANFESAVGAYVAILPEEVLGQLRDIFSKGLKEGIDLAAGVWNQTGLGATGINLDKNTVLLGQKRDQSTKARIRNYKIVLSGAGTITIPAGTTFRSTKDTTIEFESIKEFSGVAGTHRIDIIALSTGSVSVATSDITEITSPEIGLDTGDNDATSRFINGTETETDAEFRLRCFIFPVIARTLRTDAIYNAVMDINDDADDEGYTQVQQAKVIENYRAITYNGMPKNTIQILAYYPASADAVTDSAICVAIAKSKPDGIMTVTTTTDSYSETVTNGRQETLITFSRPDALPCYITVNTSPVLTANQKISLQNDIKEAGDLFEIGQSLRVFGKDSISQIVNEFDEVDIDDYEVFVSFTVTPTLSANLSCEDTEIITFDTTRIIIGNL